MSILLQALQDLVLSAVCVLFMPAAMVEVDVQLRFSMQFLMKENITSRAVHFLCLQSCLVWLRGTVWPNLCENELLASYSLEFWV